MNKIEKKYLKTKRGKKLYSLIIIAAVLLICSLVSDLIVIFVLDNSNEFKDLLDYFGNFCFWLGFVLWAYFMGGLNQYKYDNK
jgi:hypothetical protein